MEENIQNHKITSSLCISLLLVGAGLWEVTLGWEQLLGWIPSQHALYPATGTFYNPGPYCAFLGIIMPIAVYLVLKKDFALTYWIGLIYIMLAIGLMPTLMGRTGWIAAVVGSLTVALGCNRIIRPSFLMAIGIVVLAVLATVLLVCLKPASALGRLFLWRIGLSAIFEEPLTGVGWSNVSGALGNAQESYFAKHPDSLFVNVAGSPEYAFNEFLQIGIAFGIPAMMLFCAVLIGAATSLWRSEQYGLCGGVTAFCIVCFSSYPLQFPEYTALIAILLVCAVFVAKLKGFIIKIALCIMMCAFASLVLWWQMDRSDKVEDWSRKRYLTQYPLDARTIHLLDSLTIDYGLNPQFLFDYGKALRESGLLTKSNDILLRGVDISSDPMFLVLIGRNYEDSDQYKIAASFYFRAINRLPSRMYPRYLLARMYVRPEVNDTSKFMVMYKSVLEMSPKVMSPAIRQMREELDSLRGTAIFEK